IFYRAPSHSSPPYVREGDMAKKGQILCVIEAMKVFNEIKCENDCQIIKVLTENGKLVDPDQDIFIVKNK
ncbi:MAG: acetyl-CoA carboxylase, biotin carboxyl carrier protein, partial [Elusimicrobia bacterium]|nr:acetyl-CoA carboxylase, biotin carboxyl carrier protein [Elusimicrobiota bacterium]